MFKVYSDSDTYVSFSSEAFARRFYENAIEAHGWALFVTEVGSQSIVEGANLDEPCSMNTDRFEAYLKGL
jgi:hypothetical protein